jgi:crotonobetainyl-CoA:carnitine CoA-transferase CaiB-like acyl-CoA transferase
VQSALFENNIFLVAQHMLQFAVTGKAAAPMPERISPWGIYDVFSVKERRADFSGRGGRRAVENLLRCLRLRRPRRRRAC